MSETPAEYHSLEFKRLAVDRVKAGQPIEQVSKDLDIDEPMLQQWAEAGNKPKPEVRPTEWGPILGALVILAGAGAAVLWVWPHGITDVPLGSMTLAMLLRAGAACAIVWIALNWIFSLFDK